MAWLPSLWCSHVLPSCCPLPSPSLCRSTSPSIQGEDSCLLFIQISPHSHNSHYSWLVKLTFGIKVNICLLQPHPGTLIHLPRLRIFKGSQCIHLKINFSASMLDSTMLPQEALFTLIFKIFTMLQPSRIRISCSFTFILCINYHLGTL